MDVEVGAIDVTDGSDAPPSAVGGTAGAGGLTPAQLRQFESNGYVVVDDVIDIEQYIDPLVAEYDAVLDELVHDLYGKGVLASTMSGLPFGDRLVHVYAQTRQPWAQYFDFSLPLKREVRPDEPCHFGPAIFAMLRNPRILDCVESIIGPEILSNPIQHVRLKPPARVVPASAGGEGGMVGATAWHQDASVVTPDADDTPMVTVWIPVTDATIENGCLAVVPRNHNSGLLRHCVSKERGKHLLDERFDSDRATPVPMRRGSVLIMTRMTPHSSLPNSSDSLRWSMDLRYSPIGMPTGRAEFPEFVARSRTDPSKELTDADEWRRRWLAAREHMANNPHLAGTFQRWKEGACA